MLEGPREEGGEASDDFLREEEGLGLTPSPPLLLLPPPQTQPQGPSHLPLSPSICLEALPYKLTPMSDIPPSLLSLPSYGLSSPLPSHLTSQLEPYGDYRMEAFDLEREGGRSKEVTIKAELGLLCGYLGFARRFDQSILSVDLKLCLHPRLIMAFTTFLLGRGLKRGSIINHFKALINVVKWLKRNRQQEEAEVRAVV
jgi:hypothetical protein